MTKFLTRGRRTILKVLHILPHLANFLLGVIGAIMVVRIYSLAERNLVLENYLLANEINDYIAAKLEVQND